MFQVMDDKKNGKAVWVPVSTRVEDHVVVPDLDYSNIENPDEFIEDYTSHLANNPMDMSRPLWEFHVLNIKTSNAESFGTGKFHHSLGNGMSLMSLLYASSRKTSDPDAFPTTATTRKHVESKNLWWDIKTLLVGKFGDKIQSRKVIHRIISLDDVKFVKNTMNVKVNDVFLGMTQAGRSLKIFE
uniref:diacylglycerol O-acyltransferase n=1 Tax=Brassica oleracea var. oleracea TaxID=109376 RepID=A0A0D3BQP6_BRAOL